MQVHEKMPTCFPKWWYQCALFPAVYKRNIDPYSHQQDRKNSFFQLSGRRYYLIVVLICINFITNVNLF